MEQFNYTKNYQKLEDPTRLQKSPLWIRILKRILEIIIVAAVSLALAYLIVNWPALFKKFDYWDHNRNQSNSSNPTGKLPEIPDIEREGSWLIIPKIQVDAPIIWTSTVDENVILADLDNGVVHYANTAMPGEEGNVAITGHSSNYWWSQGKYNTVFATLDQLVPGDQAAILKDGKKYVYEVWGSEVVEPTRVSVLASMPESTLTLITCVPVGTNLNRLVVRARQIEPKIKKSQKKSNRQSLPEIKSLPGVR
jgi:sortase A